MIEIIFNPEECCEELSISGNICDFEEACCAGQGYSHGICDLNDLRDEKGADVPQAITLLTLFDEVEVTRASDDVIELHYKNEFEAKEKYPGFDKFVSLLNEESQDMKQLFTRINEMEILTTKKLSDNIYDAIITDLALIRRIVMDKK